MKPRARPSRTDDLLRGRDWETVKRYWRTGPGKATPCARCGKPIDRTLKAPSPWAMDAGHIVDRAKAKALGWSRAQINAITNTQPEHARCGRSAGARAGNAARTNNRARPVESDMW